MALPMVMIIPIVLAVVLIIGAVAYFATKK